MLESLRKAAGSMGGKIILALLVAAFAVWGITDVLTGSASTTAARVSGKEITVQQFAAEFSRMTRRFGMDAETARNLGLSQAALDSLVSGAAVEAEAERFGLVAGDADVAKALREAPGFQIGGVFSRERYQQAMREEGWSLQEFERRLRGDLTRDMLLQAAAEGAAPPRAAIAILEVHESERRAVRYVKFPFAGAAEPETPSDDVLKAFHEAEAPLFTTPELRAADWVLLSPASLAKPADVSEADARARYEANIARYSAPERRRVEQLLFDDEASARAAALRASAGVSLTEIGAALGRSASEIGLGLVTRDRLPADLGTAVFTLAEPGAAEPFSGGFGWTLAAATEIQPAVVTPFEQVREALAQEIANERARARLASAAVELEDYVAGGSTLPEIAARMGVEDHVLAATDKQGRDAAGAAAENLPPSGFPGFLDAIFSAQPGGLPARMDAPSPADGVLFYQLRSATPATLRPFADSREEVLRLWTERQKRDGVIARAKTAAEAAAGGAKLLEVAADLGLEVQELPPFGRRETPLDLSADLVERLFAAAQDAPVEGEAREADGRLVAVVTEIVAPEAADLTAQIDTRRQQYAERLRADLEQALIAELVRQGEPRVNAAAVEAASASAF